MTVAPTRAVGSGVVPRAADALRRGLAAIDRRALVCGLVGLGILVALSWYVAWHVPRSEWLFGAHYDNGFKDLRYRIRNVYSVRHGGVLYSSKIGTLQYFVYPPAALWLFWPLTWVTGPARHASHFSGELLWTLVSLLALAWMIASAAHRACRWRWQKAWAVSLLVATPLCAIVLQPVAVHLALGQVGLLLAAPAVFDILCVRDQRARGVLTGITAALKLYPIVYFAIFALRREWRALGNAVAAMVATTAIAWAVFPSYSATYFFHRLLGGSELRHYWHNAHWLSSSSSLYTLFFRQPFTGTAPERDLGLRSVRGRDRARDLRRVAPARRGARGRGAPVRGTRVHDRLAGGVGPLLHLGRAHPVRARRGRPAAVVADRLARAVRAHLPRAATARAQREPLAHAPTTGSSSSSSPRATR